MVSTIREFLYLISGVTKNNIIEFEFNEKTGIYGENLYIGFSQCHHHTIKHIWDIIYKKLESTLKLICNFNCKTFQNVLLYLLSTFLQFLQQIYFYSLLS